MSGSTRTSTDGFSGCTGRLSNGSTFTIGAGAKDEPWFLHLDHITRVQLTVTGYDSALYILQGADCTTGTVMAPSCMDRSAGNTESLTVVLSPGDYWVIVDGYSSGTTHTSGDYTLDVQLTDPCNGISPEGQCENSTTLTWCAVPPAGIDNFSQARITCASHESCQTVDGISGCFTKPGGSPCKPGEQRCVNSTTIEYCNSQGSLQQETCPGKCVEEAWQAFCGENTAVQTYSGTFRYQYRPPSADFTDWDQNVITAPVQGAVVVSLKRSNNEWVYIASAVTDSEGHYTINVASPPGAEDVVALMAAAPRLRRGDYAFVVAQPDVADGEVVPDITASKGIYNWSVKPASTPSGSKAVISLAQGGPMLRVFDAARTAFQNIGERHFHGTDGATLAIWLRLRTSWSCGSCIVPWQTDVQIGGQYYDLQMFVDGSEQDQGYWADSVSFHELGHWLMASYGTMPTEGGPHYIGHAYYPGMGWSEGWAHWVSAETRKSSLAFDKQQGFVFMFDIDQRKDSHNHPWPRPTPSGGLLQRIYELEVAAMLWALGNKQEVTSARLFRGLALPRAKQTMRGYTRHTWELTNDGEPTNVKDTGQPAVMLADFLDALVCSGDPANITTHVDAVTQPATYYPYPSQQPLCQ